MQRTLQLELEAIPILLASSVTEVKQPLNPTLYALSAKLMDSLQPHVQNQLEQLATWEGGRQPGMTALGSQRVTGTAWGCLAETASECQSKKVVATVWLVTGFPQRSLHPKEELPDQSLFSMKHWHTSFPREKISTQARKDSVLKKQKLLLS